MTANGEASLHHNAPPKRKTADRFHLSLFHKGWPKKIGSLDCVGQPGHLKLGFTNNHLKLGNIPRGSKRSGDVMIRNEGDVPVELCVTAREADLKGTSVNYVAANNLNYPSSVVATFSITAQPPQGPAVVLNHHSSSAVPAHRRPGSRSHSRSNSQHLSVTRSGSQTNINAAQRSPQRTNSKAVQSPLIASPSFRVNPGEEASLHVTLNVKRKGTIVFPFYVQLLGVVQAESWDCSVSGYGDDILLSEAMASYLKNERLTICRPVELHAENAHLANVLKPVDIIPSVSIQHQLKVVEPVTQVQDTTLQQLVAIPPPLTSAVLRTFKKWYYSRQPLRMSERGDEWDRFKPLLADVEQVVKLGDPTLDA